MATTVRLTYQGAAATVYLILRPHSDMSQVADMTNQVLATWADGSIDDYDLTMPSVGGDCYEVDVPSWVPEADYTGKIYLKAGASPATTDILLKSLTVTVGQAVTLIPSTNVSVIKIINMALSKIGQEPIIDLDDDNKRARHARIHYDQVRDEVLRAHTWNAATKRVALAALVATPAFGYTYQYQLPADFIRLQRLQYQTEVFRVEGTVVLSNESSLQVVYVYRLTDVTVMDAGLIRTIVAGIAHALARPLTGSDTITDETRKAFDQAMSDARFVDASEGPNEVLLGDSWLRARAGENVYENLDTGVA